MLGRALMLFFAPMITLAAQTAPVRLIISASPHNQFRIHPPQGSASELSDARRLPPALTAEGKLDYALAPGSDITVDAATSASVVHVEATDQNRVVAVGEGRSVTVRNRNGVLTIEIQRPDSSNVPPLKPLGGNH